MTLALIAGRGFLPEYIAAAQPTPPLICGLLDALPERLQVQLTFRLETLGTLLKTLKSRKITHVCFCGSVARPQLDASKLDEETVGLLPMFQKAMSAGDNGALEIVRDIFQQAGFEVVGAEQLLSDLIPRAGVLSSKQPNAQMRRDAARAAEVMAKLSTLDIGQACVVGREQVLGVEAMGGTDHLLRSLPAGVSDQEAILFKAPKLGQITQIDRPTIGVATVEAAHQAGLGGIVIAAGGVILLDADRCQALADRYRLVLWARDGGVE
ncbi:MAG: UDP-2,3-diacylglucosamine diphosphatase LpxI [Pseudomonadota bacterium]